MKRPLFWHQGLFLQPQHFQLSDAYHQSLLEPLYRYAQPHLWGVARCEIQEASLTNRTLHLVEGEFLFADTTLVTLPGNACVAARSFAGDWPGGGPLNVYLGLRKWNPAGENVTVVSDLASLEGITTRYVTTTASEEVRDLHQGGPPAQMRYLTHVLKIFWEDELPSLGDYEIIPLARLEMSGEGVSQAERFIPPCLKISASLRLSSLVREIRDQVASRARQLEEYKRDRGIQCAEFGTRDMVYLLALRSLNRYIPLLYQLTESGGVHPWHVYGVLRQLVGELSTFSEGVRVLGEGDDGSPPLPPYDHGDPGAGFSRAHDLIASLLDMITAGPDYVMPLHFDGTYYSTQLPREVFEGRNRFYLVLASESDPDELIAAIQGVAKASSRESLPVLIVRALPGVGLQHLPRPPQELPRRSQCLYFQIDHHGDQWAQVSRAGNLALYWESAPPDLKAELMVVERS